jgi:hypothetical protein
VAITVLTCGSARAATITIGSPLQEFFAQGSSATDLTSANAALRPPAIAVSPVDGTVISWTFIGAGPLRPKVIRPVGAGLYTGAGTGALQPGVGMSQRSGPYPISLPIRQGDLFGFDAPAGANWGTNGAFPATIDLNWSPPLQDGSAPGRASDLTSASELAVQGTIRYCVVPKVRGKSPKRAKRLLREADCTVGNVRKSNKQRKKKKVLRQSEAPGTSISDTQPVNLKVSRKRR